MKKKLLSVLCFIVALVLAGTVGTFIGKGIYQLRYFSSLPEYEIPANVKKASYCPLCEKVPTNGPLMVNTNVGVVSEIQIFDTELRDRLTISEKRDLYGVITSERANKGILMTSGVFTKQAQVFAQGKPIELIDGVKLKELLKDYYY